MRFLCSSHIFIGRQRMFSMGPPRDYISGTEQNQVSRTTGSRMERVLSGQGRRVRLKIDCELLQL
jgi:hypothetical protein